MGGEETREEIMDATYRALCAHGYASLTMQDIADECDRSKSLLHYHYDTKEDLLVALLNHLIERFDERIDLGEGAPRQQLVELIDLFCFGDDREDHRAFHTALLELRAQAPHNEAFRDQLRANDARAEETIAAVIRQGIDTGQFRPVDADRTASHVISAIQGARIRWVTLDHEAALVDVRETLVENLVDDWLRAE